MRPILTMLLALLPTLTSSPAALAADAGSPLPARLAGLNGYVGDRGEVVIPFRFHEARRFHGGRAVVGLDSGDGTRYGLIDPAGRWILAPRYAELHDFSEGLALFAEDTPAGRLFGYLDRAGRVALPARFHTAGVFNEGLAPVIEGDRHGYIGPDGVFRITLSRPARSLGAFNEGLAVIGYNEADHRVIDPLGGERFDSSQRLGWVVSEGLVSAYSSSRDSYSYLDGQGRVALPGHFDYALPFSEGLAAVKPSGSALLGYIDTEGALAIPARFRQAGRFRDGLAPVLLGARWGYVDRRGALAVEPRFLEAGEFEAGWAPVLTTEGPNFVDRQGRLAWDPALVPVETRERELFRALEGLELLVFGPQDDEGRLSTGALLSVHAREGEALAVARRRPGSEVLLQGENRHLLFAPDGRLPPAAATPGHTLVVDYQVSYIEADPFAESASSIARGDSTTLGLLLLARRELPANQVRAIFARLPARQLALRGLGLSRYPLLLDSDAPLPPAELESALAPVPFRNERGRWGYRDLEGREILPHVWRWAGEFDEGLAPVSTDSVSIGFIDRAGKTVIPANFQGVGAFREGLCMAIEAGMGGYIDRAGEWVVTPRFAWSGEFGEGLAPASLDGRGVGYVDRAGVMVIPPRFALGGTFAEGLAPVVEEGRTGYVGRDGELAIPCRYEEGTAFADGLAAVRLGGKVGYIDREGRTVIEHRFDAGSAFALGVALVSEGERLMLIDRAGHAVWTLE